ncbi:MAG: DinB family protein [Candidatus Zixiibacteriota bacterium]
MEKKEHLKDTFGSNQRAAKALLNDITEEESINNARGLTNHIKWQTGHIAYTLDAMVRILGGKAVLAEEWAAPYRGGVELAKDNTVYPPFAEIRGNLYKLYDRLNELIENASDDFLNGIAELSNDWKAQRFNSLIFFCKHEFYHLGQIAIIRKHLGRDRAFG